MSFNRLLLGALVLLSWQGILVEPCFASSRLPPMQKKNKNEVTDYFEQEIRDRQELEKSLEQIKAKSKEDISSSAALNMLGEPGKIKDEMENLKGISLPEAESRGFSIQAKDGDLWDRAHINYNDPQVQAHKKDTDEIARASEKLMAKLLDKLKELGIDCKQRRADKEQEPEMYIEVEQQKQKEVIYDKQLCESLRSKYNCSDTLTVKCANKAPAEFRAGTIRLGYAEMPAHWWVGLSGGQICYGAIGSGVFAGNTQVLEELKQKIIAKIGNPNVEVPPQEIMFFGGQYIYYQLDEAGNKGSVQGTWHPNAETVSGSVKFFYRVAQEEKCLQWQESWSEKCSLQ